MISLRLLVLRLQRAQLVALVLAGYGLAVLVVVVYAAQLLEQHGALELRGALELWQQTTRHVYPTLVLSRGVVR